MNNINQINGDHDIFNLKQIINNVVDIHFHDQFLLHNQYDHYYDDHHHYYDDHHHDYYDDHHHYGLF